MQKILHRITPEYLKEKGFKFVKASRAGGQDQWAGMNFWIGDKFTLRGNVSTANGGTLHLEGHYNLQIQVEEQLEKLISLYL